MAAQDKETKKKEKNYRSRYDTNRHCFRRDKTHYVYQEWIENENSMQGYYKEHVFTVGEDGITLELLDYLQATDNSEVQDQEDDARYQELLIETLSIYEKGPEESLFDDEEPGSKLLQEFVEKVRDHLSEEQMDFIYERFGACKTLDEIAESLQKDKDGKTISRSAVLGRQKRIIAKVEKYMPQD